MTWAWRDGPVGQVLGWGPEFGSLAPTGKVWWSSEYLEIPGPGDQQIFGTLWLTRLAKAVISRFSEIP